MTSNIVPDDRRWLQRARTRGRAILPLVLVLTSLSALALLPMFTMKRTGALRSRVATMTEPARAQVTRIQNAIALETAATRLYLLTGDSAALAHHATARGNRERAIRRLIVLSTALGEETRTTTGVLQLRLQAAEPLLDSLFSGLLTRTQYTNRIVNQQDRLEDVLDAAAAVDSALSDEVTETLTDARHVETLGAALTMAFVLLALVAAALVANLTREYQESEERFRQIAEAMHDFVWLSDTHFTRHLFANEAYERIWGRPRAELYGNPTALLTGVHPEDRERVRHALNQLATTPYDIEFRVVRPDGEVRWVWSRAFPVRNARGDVYRVAGITEDITDRKLANESRLRLIRGFTHDVKNPLGAAEGHLSLLEDGLMGALTPPQAESIGRVRRSIKSALDLVAQLLDIARAEAGQLNVEHVPVDIRAAAQDVVDEFRAAAAAKNISMSVEIEPLESGNGNGYTVESDPARVRQVVANLVSNAVKYTHPAGRISVSARLETNGDARGDSWVAIAVNDNGPGIPYEKQNLLFREFTRFDPGAAQGSGIGLAISQRVARALDGKITFTSKPGSGSSFTLWLPAERREVR